MAITQKAFIVSFSLVPRLLILIYFNVVLLRVFSDVISSEILHRVQNLRTVRFRGRKYELQNITIKLQIMCEIMIDRDLNLHINRCLRKDQEIPIWVD